MKNKDIPSIPNVKLKFKKGIHKVLFTNWNIPIEALNHTHKKREQINVKADVPNPIIFKKILLLEGINNNNEIPSSGKTNSIKRFLF